MNTERVCTRYCRIGNTEYLPGTQPNRSTSQNI